MFISITGSAGPASVLHSTCCFLLWVMPLETFLDKHFAMVHALGAFPAGLVLRSFLIHDHLEPSVGCRSGL